MASLPASTEERDTSAFSLLHAVAAYLERETARRKRGGHPGMIRLRDDELAALLALLRRELGTTS